MATRLLDRRLCDPAAEAAREKLRSVHAGGFGAATEAQMALVDKAETLGLVERRIDPEDRRAEVVAFTPLGLELLGRVRQGVVVAERRMTTVAGTDFMLVMQGILAAYVAATNPAVDGLKIPDIWRKPSISRVLMLASGVFVQDVLRSVLNVAGIGWRCLEARPVQPALAPLRSWLPGYPAGA